MRAPQLPEAPPIALVFLGLANLPHEAETLELNAGNQSTSLLESSRCPLTIDCFTNQGASRSGIGSRQENVFFYATSSFAHYRTAQHFEANGSTCGEERHCFTHNVPARIAAYRRGTGIRESRNLLMKSLGATWRIRQDARLSPAIH
jgi:hypothetical protein